MSPSAALHNRLFLAYAVITVAVLAIAALVIHLRGRSRNLSAVWVTYRSWLVMIPAIGACIFMGNWAVVGGTTVLVLLGFREFAGAAAIRSDHWMFVATLLMLLASGVFAFVHGYTAFSAMPGFATLLLLAIPVLRDRTQGQLRLISLSLIGFAQGWLVLHLALLVHTANPYGTILFVVLATELNDVAAFTAGRLFGRHPLRHAVSPKKTWEGAIGAAAFSIALAFALRFSLPRFHATHILLTGLIVGVGGQLGDLSISVIKRDLGIKDLGSAIPGHGGILDRIDSLTFVAPLFFYVVRRVG